MDWLPISAAALLTGATALVIGAQLIPRPDGEGALLRLASEEPDLWLALSILLSLAAVGLIVGMPSLFVLFQPKGFRTGLVATFALSVGAVLLAGFAQALIIFRGLAVEEALTEETLRALGRDGPLRGMLVFGIVVFYLGELLLASALLRARTTPRWVPWAFLAHVGTVPLQVLLPEETSQVSVVLMTAGFAGAGIAATRRSAGALAVSGRPE